MAGGSIPGLTFEWSVAVSALLAGLVCTLITVVIERLGGLVGGVLGSVPTTIIPASMGFYFQYRSLGFPREFEDLTSQPGLEEYQRSMVSCVPGMVLNAIYLLMWRHLPPLFRRRFPTLRLTTLLLLVFLLSILIWLALASLLVAGLRAFLPSRAANIPPQDPATAPLVQVISPNMTGTMVFGFATLGLQIVVGVLASWTPPPAPKSLARVPVGVLVARGIFAGLAIGASILIGRVSSYAGGVASVFPVIFTTSVVAIWVSSGEAVSSGAIGPLMLGSASVGLYALLSAVLVVPLGFVGASVVAWVASVLGVSAPSFVYLRWRRRVREASEGNSGDTLVLGQGEADKLVVEEEQQV
ncbi:hypothetical protein BCR44DRAFT_118042 [Catenaria anguillulae PL171]|uniref:Uncharacterized protein n=1 Tax=Catenaria anguillulae PL171 TaxID=765915 RepID=A0A1Y2HPT5_9FUNG|nr:hypothetical protein BCR44DRAFT_118042 [Catenaria anguillulae PL171]